MHVKSIDKTRFGPVVVAWSGKKPPTVVQVLLSTGTRSANRRAAERYPAATPSSCREIDQLATRIAALLNGEDVAVSPDLLAWERCSAFLESVLRAALSIPRGYVATYGGLAAHAGCPHGARAVGNAMATNPFPLLIPCHRVIRADLTPGVYGGGADMKRALLVQEGMVFDARGKVPETRVVFRSESI